MAANELQNILEEIRADKNAHLKPKNLKKNVTVLGITGTLDGGIDTEDATATAADILEGETAYAKDEKLTGTMPNNGLLNYNPLTSEQLIPAGYTSGGRIAPVTSSIDPNITQANIRAGVSILGVQGNLQPDKPDQTKTATPTTSQQIIEPDTGYELASVTINAVTSSIDQNIIADNIREGVTILGITGTLEEGIDTTDATAVAGDIMLGKTAYAQGEKITGTFTIENELSAQEQKLEALETILEGKVGGGAVRANIYVQENEPTKKDGIWLKMSGKTAEHYISDDNIFVGGSWSNKSDVAQLPVAYQTYSDGGTAFVYNNKIYFLYTNSSNSRIYNPMTNTYSAVSLSIVNNSYHSNVVLGNKLYLLNGNSGNGQAHLYEYNLDEPETPYVDLGVVGSYFRISDAMTSVGTDLYYWWSGSMYKYDTINRRSTYLDSAEALYRSASGLTGTKGIGIGTYLYLFGGSSSFSTKVYKYDTITDTFIQLNDCPINFSSGSITLIGNDVYLFKGNYAYKYNVLTDTYTQLTNIPYSLTNGGALAIGTDIYVFGGWNTTNNMYRFHAQSKTYSTDNTVVIAQGRTYSVGYNTKLFETNFETGYQPLYGFADAWFYTLQDGLDGTMPVYYGNGTQWINIKNPPQNNGGEE